MADHTLYTIGYQERSLKAFISLLEERGAGVLVDVRDTPWSRKPGFSKRDLAEALAGAGIEYVHAGFAGNPKSIRKGNHEDVLARYYNYLLDTPWIFDRLTALLEPIYASGRSACLMCYERHPDDCHRSVLTREWAKRSSIEVAIVHLAPEGARRLSSGQSAQGDLFSPKSLARK